MTRQFVLMTDTGSDLPKEYYVQHDLACVRLGFTLDGVTYGGDDGAEMDDKKFYDLLRGGAMPKTFQITPAQAVGHIEPFLKEGKDVLVISFSSGLSGTYESYCTAAKELSGSYSAMNCLALVRKSIPLTLAKYFTKSFAPMRIQSFLMRRAKS